MCSVLELLEWSSNLQSQNTCTQNSQPLGDDLEDTDLEAGQMDEWKLIVCTNAGMSAAESLLLRGQSLVTYICCSNETVTAW